VGTLDVTGGLEIDADINVEALTLDGDEVVGSAGGTMTVTNSFSESNVTMGGNLSIGSGVTWSVYGLTVLGQLTNDGSATVGPSETITLGASADFTNSGTLTMGEGSEINESCTTYSNVPGNFYNTGTFVVDPGTSEAVDLGAPECWLTFFDTGTIDLNSGTLDDEQGLVLESGASESGPGTLEISASLLAEAPVSLGTVVLDDQGDFAIDFQGDVDVSSLSGSGTVLLISNTPTGFGEIIATNSAIISNIELDVDSQFAPSCGMAVTAVEASAVSGPFSAVSGQVPSGGTWEVSNTSTTAGGMINC
jgi:hypothetical protein